MIPWWLGCPDLNTFQLCKLLFDTVMYGYNMDQNPKELIHSLNVKAPHRVFVKQWEISEFTIGETTEFSPNIFL